MSVFFTILTFLFILVSVALVLVILVQRPQGGGLASAFGGGGGTDTAFGGRTGDALTVGTVSVFVVYLILAMALNIFDPQAAPTTSKPAVTESTTQSTPVNPSATMPAPDGTSAPAGAIPVTPVTAPSTDGAAPATAPIANPASENPAAAEAAPTAAPATIPATNPAKPQQL